MFKVIQMFRVFTDQIDNKKRGKFVHVACLNPKFLKTAKQREISEKFSQSITKLAKYFSILI